MTVVIPLEHGNSLFRGPAVALANSGTPCSASGPACVISVTSNGGGHDDTGSTTPNPISHDFTDQQSPTANGGNLSGNGGDVSVTLDNAFYIYNGDVGGAGVLAQSIGGGGGVIGGMSQIDLAQAVQATPTTQAGQGGNVGVGLENGGNIVTNGTRAHGIVAQSLAVVAG